QLHFNRRVTNQAWILECLFVRRLSLLLVSPNMSQEILDFSGEDGDEFDATGGQPDASGDPFGDEGDDPFADDSASYSNQPDTQVSGGFHSDSSEPAGSPMPSSFTAYNEDAPLR